GGFRQALDALVAFDRQHPDIIRAITLAGEIHHFLSKLADPNAAGQFEGAHMTDYSAASTLDFRRWLQNKYATVGRLNDQFATPFESWEKVEPPRWDL